MSTLYRQYRPQTFSDISGQKHITDTLKQSILKDRISHAYLFQGPRGTGKTTTARILAKRLNCLKPKKEEPCTKCINCEAAQQHRLTDLIEIDAASNRGIDDIRALRETIGLSPSQGKYKIYIIDEVHMLTNEAFAALLKTLEEPVKHAIFILATTELHKVPPTILSRCQVYRFRRATSEEMKSRLEYLLTQEKRDAKPDALDFIIQRSDGCYRDAESLLGQMLTFHEKTLSRDNLSDFLGLPSPDLVENLLTTMVKKDSAAALKIAHDAYEDGFDPDQLIEESIRLARDTALSVAKNSPDTPAWAKEGNTAQQLPNIIRALLQASQDLSYVPQPLIALQLAILTVCGSAAQKPPIQTQQQVAPKIAPNSRLKIATPVQKTEQTVSKSPQKTYTPPVENSTQVEDSSPASFSIEKIKEVWSQLIEGIKATNPVSSTFLRATEPVSVSGSVLNIKVYYPLHHNFFIKPENKNLIEKKLSELVNSSVVITCVLESNNSAPQGQEDELYNNVKDIFGS